MICHNNFCLVGPTQAAAFFRGAVEKSKGPHMNCMRMHLINGPKSSM